MKLAFSTLGCPGWSWDEIFATAKDVGMDGIEVRGIENQMSAPRIKVLNGELLPKTKRRLEQAGMEICMLTSGASLGLVDTQMCMEEAKDYIDLAAELGTPFVRVLLTESPQPVRGENIWQAKELYTKLCDYAGKKNVCVLIETSGALANSLAMRDFMQGIDPKSGGVLWDLHHPYRYYGESPEQTYGNIGEWVKYIHVKDSVLNENEIAYRMMGYGDLPIFDAVKLLYKNGYSGYITLEWVKRWCPELQEPGIVFAHYASYMKFLLSQI